MKSRVRDAFPGSPKSHDPHIKAQGYDEWHWHITPCPASLSQKCRLLKPEGLTSFFLENRVVWPAGKGSRWPTNVPLNSTAVTCQKYAVNHFPVSSSGIFFLAKTKILGEPGRSSWLCCSCRLGSAERHSPGLTLVPAQAVPSLTPSDSGWNPPDRQRPCCQPCPKWRRLLFGEYGTSRSVSVPNTFFFRSAARWW